MDIKSKIQDLLNEEILLLKPCSGGCTAQSYMIKSQSKQYFLKTLGFLSDVFQKEVNGLNSLKVSGELVTPEVVFFNEEFLCLNWIESRSVTTKSYESFGKSLARHHRQQGLKIGLNENNYIGKTKQINKNEISWADFFIKHRLKFQYNLLLKNGLSSSFIDSAIYQIYELAEDILKIDEPLVSPLHGDLWGGNHLMNLNEEIVLIDPAFYFGHREADLALMRLFGSYPEIFFESYQKEWPLLPDYQKRFYMYQLYHAFNHINLEGTSYLSMAEGIINELIG